MSSSFVQLNYIGGPTSLLSIGGLNFLTDPTFDPPESEFHAGLIHLRKHIGPAIQPEALGRIDVVLLSHDQHWDNFDTAGKQIAAGAGLILTTKEGASRLGSNAHGLAPWDTYRLTGEDGVEITVTATPARHGPSGIEPVFGEVIGFVLSIGAPVSQTVYITGDTVFYEGIREVSERFTPGHILLFAGAAKPYGPFHVTMSVNDALDTSFLFPDAVIIPLHHEGWNHYTQGPAELSAAFAAFQREDRLIYPEPGIWTPLNRRSSMNR